MRRVKWNAFLSGLCAFAVVLGVVAAGARADVTTEKGASILVFPKVRADANFDTIVQIANTGNNMVFAHCFYVDGSLVNTVTQLPCTLPGPLCVPSCLETDFTIWLTKQQPTHWRVSTGRNFNPLDALGSDGAGFDPGLVPPVSTVPGFLGELKCIEIDESGAPVTGNHLKGEATLMTAAGDVSKYNAIGIEGNANVSPTNPLLLDGNTYDACPAKTILNHFATGATDPVAAEFPVGTFTAATEATELTLVPCSEDFEHQVPTTVTLQFLVTNEFEDQLSFSATLSCFLNAELTNLGGLLVGTSNPFTLSAVGSDVASTEITPAVNTDGTVNAVIGVAERIVTVTTAVSSSARAAYNLHTQGDLIAVPPDQIVLPGDP